ncbi:Hypothetical protein A7982_11710 [Minicystis rosea]|nr:Hypothetical protein A7982_11710 [Minicystis rosea]
MDEGFLGVGVRFGLSDEAPGIDLDSVHHIAAAGGEDAIRQSIWLILGTAPGERVGRPSFGCGIHDLIFAPRTAGTMGDVIRAVESALTRWEPRIDVLDVDAYPHPDDPAGLIVEIHYEVRATNSRVNLVYPFYLST